MKTGPKCHENSLRNIATDSGKRLRHLLSSDLSLTPPRDDRFQLCSVKRLVMTNTVMVGVRVGHLTACAVCAVQH